MPTNDQLREILVQASIFCLVAALWIGAVVLWAMRQSHRRQMLHRRLDPGGTDRSAEKVLRLWHDGESAEATVPRDRGMSFWQKLEQFRIETGWAMSLELMLAIVLGAPIVAAIVILLVTENVLLAGAGVVVSAIILRALVLRSMMKQTILFEKEFLDALELGARSLRAGHPLSGAFQLISEEIDPPLGTMFQEIVEQESLGVSLQEALSHAAENSRSPDLKLFAASVLIQLRSGGNLADMMDRVNLVIRERMRLIRRARVLTAEAQLSKWVLLALPIALFVLLNLINRAYMEPFFSTMIGMVMLAGGCASLAIGAWVMSRMAVLKY